MVIARFTARGPHKAEFQGILATGNTVEASGIGIGPVKDKKIVEAVEDWDALGMMRQLGMELRPKEGMEKEAPLFQIGGVLWSAPLLRGH
jgi:hypothetical protein